jgi:hypothetical protein
VLQLEINFRSHDGILRPANAVVSTIVRLFPNSIDQLGEERGARRVVSDYHPSEGPLKIEPRYR